MAFHGGMRRAVNGAVLGLAFAGAGAGSFYFFEDVYQAVEQRWPGMASSVAEPSREAPLTVSSVSSQNSEQTKNEMGVAFNIPEMRASLTGFSPDAGKRQKPRTTIRKVTLAANTYGHHVVEAEINGAKVELLTDTGATYVALNYRTALKLGFTPKLLHFTSRSTTANGVARVAPVTLDSLRIGSIMLREVRAVVAEPGKMTQNLLGMSFISRLSNFELKGGTLVMIQNDAQ
ncbi:MAG: TIGR02281 family clan AA aspartic protease [Alphaproteobacteria bacterium]